ncbi:MAG: hypothetical protein JRN15_16135 [Nitrososphaerota archaeon]|nr:hypothetical protein [Nitrososphaerota archaeon]
MLITYFVVSIRRSWEMSSYREREKLKEKIKEEARGHNHPANEKCGTHCPRNEHYKGPVKKFNLLERRK